MLRFILISNLSQETDMIKIIIKHQKDIVLSAGVQEVPGKLN